MKIFFRLIILFSVALMPVACQKDAAPGPAFYIVSSFTPNHDGLNDIWIPYQISGTMVTTYDLHVFDADFRPMFYTEDMEQGWDGILNGDTLPSGFYFYQLEYTASLDSGLTYLDFHTSGQVELIR